MISDADILSAVGRMIAAPSEDALRTVWASLPKDVKQDPRIQTCKDALKVGFRRGLRDVEWDESE